MTMDVLTSFFQLLHEYLSFWLLQIVMTFLHHNDITSAKVNTAAPWSHRGPLEHNLEPDLVIKIIYKGHRRLSPFIALAYGLHSYGQNTSSLESW